MIAWGAARHALWLLPGVALWATLAVVSATRLGKQEDRMDENDCDGPLLERLKAGDDAAFEVLVRRHAARLLCVARRFFRNEDDAQDALQDAFLSAHRALASFQGDARLSTWLHRIVVNSCLMKLRSRRRRPEEELEPLLPQFLEEGHQVRPSLPWRDLSDELERKATCGMVRSFIERLPATYRTVLLLRDIEELDTKETAEALGLTENAVKIRLHRARQALRQLLDPHMTGGLS